MNQDPESMESGRKHRAEIEYCTQCRWMLRAAWMAQELLSTFESDLAEVAPGRNLGHADPR